MSESVAAAMEQISDSDWAQTPDSVKHLHWRGNSQHDSGDSDWAQTPDSVKRSLLERIEQLERQYGELKAENAMLREQIGRNS